jgi:hypothetical protein
MPEIKDAKALFTELLDAIPDGGKAATLFAEDGVLELPFLHSVGIEPRYEGRRAIADFYGVVKSLYPDFAFKSEDRRVLIETSDQVFAEYTAHTTAAATGRKVHHHLFAGRLVAENGRIKLLRESLNVAAAAQALLPGGAKDLPAPASEIHSIKPGYKS